ncbi:sulfate ABC transporter substrate-binding protein [Candidatus Chloroploca asiatica]|uniref:Sulfate ABC transporter substrate-binding protein n=1 Tax=Candidatus Chloroploca asiatica TaxID=1506545 RepID=A0A2H3KSX3_9CHLR|nr:sulfate ABC transporter substrate-binding protein [Candidatus Chloroploca asiatica]
MSLVRRRHFVWLMVLLLLAGCTLSGQRLPAGDRLRLAYFPNVTHGVALVGVARGTFQEALGPEVTLVTTSFNAGPSLVEALFAGEVDLGYLGPNPAINGYVRSNSEAVRIIAGAAEGGAALVVRPEAGINGPSDFAGKRFATPQYGGTQDVALRHLMQQYDLKPADRGGTVTILPSQNPDILTLFRKGDLDGAWVPEPWVSRLVLEAGGTVLIDERSLWPEGRFISTVLVVHPRFLREHPDLVEAFLRAHVDTVQYMQAQPATAAQLINQEIERITTRPLPEEVLKRSLTTLEFTYDPLPATLLLAADHAYALGFLGATEPDLQNIYDLALLNKVLGGQGLAPMVLP